MDRRILKDLTRSMDIPKHCNLFWRLKGSGCMLQLLNF